MPSDLKTVSVVLTSGSLRNPATRKEIFLNTIQSFLKFNTYPIEKFIITEDSPCATSLDHIIELLTKNRLIEEVVLIDDGKNRGQVYRIDQSYSLVESDFIFHCEEDWEFVKLGFIETSLDVLNDDNIFSVYLHGYHDYISRLFGDQGYSVMDAPHLSFKNPEEPFMVLDSTEYNTSQYKYPFFAVNKKKFKKIKKNWNSVFAGFSFNPGLRRLKDYQAVESYSSLLDKTDRVPKHDPGTEVEIVAGQHYSDEGFDFAVTKEKYATHIGIGDTDPRFYPPYKK
tara:strand:- start:11599 stop:12447 length:849 start_codon:yes stop_codon:yes gene_type:complete